MSHAQSAEQRENRALLPSLATLQILALMVVVSAVLAWGVWDRPRALLAPGKAVLVEAPAQAGQPPTPLDASVVWHFVAEGSEVVADVTVPARELSVKLTFRKNTDPTLPASYLVEIAAHTAAGFPGGGVSDVVGLALKPEPTAAGTLLVGSPAKIDEGLFWLGLSPEPADIAANLALLRTQGFFGLQLVEGSGRGAMLVFEKGASGERAFEKAILAWTR